jgi:two-component system chemotaxis response regulator CheB
MNCINVLIIDESALFRDIIRNALDNLSDIKVVGQAPSAAIGLEKIRHFRPDVVVLGVDARGYSPANFAAETLNEFPDLGIVITTRNVAFETEEVIKALEAGAFDFVLTPQEESPDAEEVMSRRLLPKIRSFSAALYSRKAQNLFGDGAVGAARILPAEGSIKRAGEALAEKKRARNSSAPEIVLIGISTGGPEALAHVVPLFPATFHLPIVVVIHLPKQFTASLAATLNLKSALPVSEASEDALLQQGSVYIAAGGIHAVLDRDSKKRLVLRSDDGPPENGCKPSVDVLFHSAAKWCPKSTIAVIMTGMGEDGVKGMKELKETGAILLAQNQASSVIWGMPGAAVRAGLVQEVLPLHKLAARIMELS